MKRHPTIFFFAAALLCITLTSFSYCKEKKFDNQSDESNSRAKLTYKDVASTIRKKGLNEPLRLSIFRRAFPYATFECTYDERIGDHKIVVTVDWDRGKKRRATFYWAGSRFLPPDRLSYTELYRPLLYVYPDATPDPRAFSHSYINHIKELTSEEGRAAGPIDPPFLYDLLYDTATRESIESHIKSFPVLSKTANVHEALESKLALITKRVNEAAAVDKSVANFLKDLKSAGGFNYRSVRDTQNRSFHSIGLAVDILPNDYQNKTIYWLWRREMVGEKWYTTPLKIRWMPPKRVIKIFEDYGFIWGGKWIVWDNMHFEYHPEVILYNKERRKEKAQEK